MSDWPPTSKDIVVFDLDGTLSNPEHRLYLVRRKQKRFDLFYASSAKDSVNWWAVALLLAMRNKGYEVEIVSARPESLFESTTGWLREKAGLNPRDYFIKLNLLRKSDLDFTEDWKLKEAWLKEDERRARRILFVVDDRKRVVDMWRRNGIVCLQCDDWKEFNDRQDS